MSKLQQALSQVNPPKVNPRVALQGGRYQGSTQQAANVSTENVFNQTSKLFQLTGQLIQERDTAKTNEATKLYEQSVAQGLDPMEVAARKAKEESTNVIDWALETTFQGGDRDPLYYMRSVNASKRIEQAAFDIDKDIEIALQNGTITSHKDMLERRSMLRDKAFTEISEETGVKSDNRFFSAGAAKNNEASLFALNQRWAQVEEAQIQVDNQRRLNAGLNDLVKTGTYNPQAYHEYLNKSFNEGIIRNEKEMWAAITTAANHAVELGNPALLNGMLDFEMTIGGEKRTFGDALDEASRGELFAKAEANLINNNEKLFDEYSDLKSNVMLLSQAGNGGAALSKIKEIEAWLDRHQPSDRVTPQRRELAGLKQQVMSAQLAENMRVRASNAKKAEDMEQEQVAWELMSANSIGQTVDFGAVPMAAYDRVAEKRLKAINSAGLEPAQAAEAYGQLISMLPSGSNAHKVLGDQYKRGLASVEMAMVATENGQASPEMATQAQSTLQLFKANPLVARSVLDAESYQRMNVLSEKVDRLGWTMATSTAANQPLDADSEKYISTEATTIAREMGLTKAQTEAFLMDARVQSQMEQAGKFYGTNTGVKYGVKAAKERWESQRVEIDTGMQVNRDDLAARANPETIPVVQGYLKTEIARLREEGRKDGFSFYTLQRLEDGQYAAVNAHTGVMSKLGTPDDMYDKAIQMVKDGKPNALEELKAAANAAVTRRTSGNTTWNMEAFGVKPKNQGDKPKVKQPDMQDFWQRK